MVKKKSIKKRKNAKLTVKEKEELKAEGEIPKKSVREKENKQLIWFFIIIGIVFATVLISYLGIEGAKHFEYNHIDWLVEEYPNLQIFHGKFMALSGTDVSYNIFLRNDPRKNNVLTEGTFDKFKYGGIISFSPEVDTCRGELSRAIVDVGAFLRQGVGVGDIKAGSTNETIASIDDNKLFAQCDTVLDRTVVVVEMGEPSVVQNIENPYCYTISIEDCNDIKPIERFMVKSVEDFMVAKKALEENSETA
jgi:hypothetical protein